MHYPASGFIGSARVAALLCSMLCFIDLTLVSRADAAPAYLARIGAISSATRRGMIAQITVNGQPVATLHTAAAGLSPAARAVSVKTRLTALVADGLTPTQITAASLGRQGWVVRARGLPLLSVTPREASTQKQTARRLASVWTRNLQQRLGEPPLTLSARQFLLPFGSSRTVTVGGAAVANAVTAIADNPHLVTASFDPARRQLRVRGIGAGQTQVVVRSGGVSLPLFISIRKYAAFVAPRVTVRVTGRPDAPAALVQTALYLGLKHALNATEGAQVRLSSAPKPVGALRPNETVTRRISVRVAGTDLLPVVASPIITVVNQPLAPARAEAMYYSNNPEQVRSARTLFTAPLDLMRPIRLDYHHQNSSNGPLIFHTDIVNTGDQTATVHLMAGVAVPQVDTVQIGRRAGAAFLQALDSGTGIVFTVRPHTRVPLVVQPFALHLTVSGILQVQQLSGPEHSLSLSVTADSDQETLSSSAMNLAEAIEQSDSATARLVSAPAASLASGSVRPTSPFVFGPPRVALDRTYTVGGPWAYLRLGNAESLRNAEGTQTLWGNYGVSYFVTLQVSNPSPSPRVVGIFFAAEAGLAAGVFQVSGEPLLEFDPMAPPEEKQITRVRLAPGAAQTLRIRTILLNGSAYPASLIVHAL